jgi:nucleotide-binding universal stress UspA family protein
MTSCWLTTSIPSGIPDLAEVAAVHPNGGDVPSIIQDAAIEGRADLLIAGAYGHSTVREAMFGGVTRGLLDNLRIPVLLSH